MNSSATPGETPSTAIDAGPPRLVPAVERAVLLLDTLAGTGHPLSLADLARSLALPKSSVHGLLTTLVALGLVRRDANGQFALGAKPLQWADAFASQSGLLRAFEANARGFPALQAETVMLAVLEGADVTYLSCRQGSRALAVNFRVGGRFPAACTSSGKAMLASMPDDSVSALLGAGPLPRLTRHSVATVPALLGQLAAARARGYALDDEETAEGMQCFGAPIFAARQPQAVAAVAVSVIKAGLAARRRDEIVAAITGLAREISGALGGAQVPAVAPPAR
jgi:DNA-binding IclR family transcriptional regulator